jgi:hypothetical protein
LLFLRQERKAIGEGAKLDTLLILVPEIIDPKFCPEDQLS